MTSQLNVDTIVDKAGSGGTNVKIANNAVTVSEGGNATAVTIQGLTKMWVQHNDGASVSDSFNVGSTTDNGTGDYTFALSSSISSANYSHPIVPADADGGGGLDISVTSKAAGSIRVGTIRDDSTKTDNANISVSIFGDLA